MSVLNIEASPEDATAALAKFGPPPSCKVERPVISIDRQTGMMGIFDEFELIWGFKPFGDEEQAVQLAKVWLSRFCEAAPEIRYPCIRRIRVN